jgi:hypothetical protein
MNKDLFFYSIGCSFTWGQGLPLYRYAEKNGWSHKEEDLKDKWWLLNEYGVYPDYWMTHNDFIYQFKNRYSGLLAKKLKCEYSSKLENGGQNDINLSYLNNIVLPKHRKSIHEEKKLDFIILQLTLPDRENQGSVRQKSIDDIIDNTSTEVLRLNTNCEKNNIKLFVWSWPMGFESLSKEDFWVPLVYENKTYNSMEDMEAPFLPNRHRFEKKFLIPLDAHPNLKMHKIICDSIYKKIIERINLH